MKISVVNIRAVHSQSNQPSTWRCATIARECNGRARDGPWVFLFFTLGRCSLESVPRDAGPIQSTRGRAMAKAVRKDEPIEALLQEGRKFPPAKAFTKSARVRSMALYQEARRNPVRFWEREAKELAWIKPWTRALEWKLPYAKWFIGGRLHASANCLDR